MPASVSQWLRSSGPIWPRRRPPRPSARGRKPPAPEHKEPAEAHDRVRERVVGVGLPLHAAEADPLHHAVATMPVGANGESVPASAPLPAMMAISSGGMPARAATAIAGGASSALVGVPPGPIVAMHEAQHEEHDRQQPAWPRHSRTARAVTRPSVPLRLGDAEEQRHADERHEERRRKPLEHARSATCRPDRRRRATPAPATGRRR